MNAGERLACFINLDVVGAGKEVQLQKSLHHVACPKVVSPNSPLCASLFKPTVSPFVSVCLVTHGTLNNAESRKMMTMS